MGENDFCNDVSGNFQLTFLETPRGLHFKSRLKSISGPAPQVGPSFKSRQDIKLSLTDSASLHKNCLFSDTYRSYTQTGLNLRAD